MKKGVPRNSAQFKGKHLCKSLFFNKVAGLRPASLLKKRPWHRCFPVNFAKFLRTPFLQNTSGRLLLAYLWEQKKNRFSQVGLADVIDVSDFNVKLESLKPVWDSIALRFHSWFVRKRTPIYQN